MTLAAAQVIDAQAARLVGLPLTGSRVYTSRLWPITEAELPAWRVTAQVEVIQAAMLSGVNEHRLSIEFAGYVRATQDIDDAMHALAAQGLTALCAAPTLHGLQITGIDRDTPIDGAEASMAAIRITADTLFFVNPAEPETII